MTAQNMGKKILAESGYEVTTVSNGAAAVKKIAEVKPDVVILDIYMPGYTGLEVCERVRANLDTANLPVLLTVGKMEPYRAEDGAKVRADGVIVKPFEATDLLAVVKKMAEKAAPSAPQREPEVEAAPVEEEIGEQSEPEMPAAVEVPSEMAAAPALVMDEFSTIPAEVPELKTTIEWSAPQEMQVEQSVHSAMPEQETAEIQWSFDQASTPTESEMAAAPAMGLGSSEEVEFTAAPQTGALEVQPEEGLEGGLEAPPTGDLEIGTDPGLTSPQEITDFVTTFGDKNTDPTAEGAGDVIAELPTFTPPAESAWDGWAHAEPKPVVQPSEAAPEPASSIESDFHSPDEAATPVMDDFEAKVAAAMAGFSVQPQSEPAVEHQKPAPAEAPATPNVDDFDARVAAAMAGFGTEPIPAPPDVAAETPAQPVETESAADDFEARVAAAMSGFATDPVDAEPVNEAHAEPVAEVHPERMAETHTESPVEETSIQATPALAGEQDDFDARLAQALSAFDTAPEAATDEAVSVIGSSEPAVEPHLAAPTVDLNETMVLPHEAILSLEEEMKKAVATHSLDATNETAEMPAYQVSAEPVSEPEMPPVEMQATEHSEAIPEPEPMPLVEESVPPQLPLEAVAAFAAAASTEPVEAPKPSSEKFADAVQRAIERLKPQLIAEIVKELKGE
jgi:CheY-like chemotaxis protein